jgi:hypothetical protein
MSTICIIVITLSAIVKDHVGTKTETNDNTAIANSLHKKEKRVTCHDILYLGSIQFCHCARRVAQS